MAVTRTEVEIDEETGEELSTEVIHCVFVAHLPQSRFVASFPLLHQPMALSQNLFTLGVYMREYDPNQGIAFDCYRHFNFLRSPPAEGIDEEDENIVLPLAGAAQAAAPAPQLGSGSGSDSGSGASAGLGFPALSPTGPRESSKGRDGDVGPGSGSGLGAGASQRFGSAIPVPRAPRPSSRGRDAGAARNVGPGPGSGSGLSAGASQRLGSAIPTPRAPRPSSRGRDAGAARNAGHGPGSGPGVGASQRFDFAPNARAALRPSPAPGPNSGSGSGSGQGADFGAPPFIFDLAAATAFGSLNTRAALRPSPAPGPNSGPSSGSGAGSGSGSGQGADFGAPPFTFDLAAATAFGSFNTRAALRPSPAPGLNSGPGSRSGAGSGSGAGFGAPPSTFAAATALEFDFSFPPAPPSGPGFGLQASAGHAGALSPYTRRAAASSLALAPLSPAVRTLSPLPGPLSTTLPGTPPGHHSTTLPQSSLGSPLPGTSPAGAGAPASSDPSLEDSQTPPTGSTLVRSFAQFFPPGRTPNG